MNTHIIFTVFEVKEKRYQFTELFLVIWIDFLFFIAKNKDLVNMRGRK